ncbi:MAG: glycoside hydrolase family 43 protein [Acetatifactor sp.]|nr:glycoside hydrolase family 43 protein [Acetatifactor sp.]
MANKIKHRICRCAGALSLLGLLLLPIQVQAQGASHSVTTDGITVTIETDKEEYKAGEEIQYSITVENGKDKWDIGESSFTYSNTNGLIPAQDGSMPDTLPEILSGESHTITGRLKGDPEIFSGMSSGGGSGMIVGVAVAAAAAVVIIIAVIILFLRGKKKGAKAAALFLALSLLAGESLPAQAAANETITLRPYVNVTYGGQEVTIRAVMELKMKQQLMVIEPEDRKTYQRITCHDPSIFKDFDGTYYILGTFLTGGSTTDLYNWTSLDAQIQGGLSQEVRDQVKAWNEDENADGWNGYLWAPDIIYNPHMEKYCMYLSANGDKWKSNIVLLTSDNVTGPYEYGGSIVYGGFDADTYKETDAPMVLGESEIPERYVINGIANNKWGDMWPNCIDPCVIFDDDGNLWMSYGSWSGGIFMLELDEETGLRDYSVTYENDVHSDAYFGTKIAGGSYASGEASYIQKIGDYYYLFISYGALEAKGGYNVRIFRSERPDGDYVDMLGNSAYFDRYVQNFNLSVGVRLMGGYKWRNFNVGQVAQGHNSAFVDDDGRAYMVFHTRTANGTEGHNVKVHQLFVTKEGWLVAAPYQTTGEALKPGGYTAAEVAGDYEIILHRLDIDYENLDVNQPESITLTEDGKITGDYEGTWELESGTSYITLNFNGQEYSGVTVSMEIEYTSIETMTFTAVGLNDQITLWGSRCP